MRKNIPLGQKIFLVLFGLIVALLLLELALRIGGWLLLSSQERDHRIAVSSQEQYRIICLGESTTFFGGEDSYPRQLETILREKNKELEFTVFNKGVPAIDTGVILSQLEENLKQYSPDMVVVMMGINDGWVKIPQSLDKNSNSLDDTAFIWVKDQHINYVPYQGYISSKDRPLFQSLRIYKLAKYITQGIVARISGSDNYSLSQASQIPSDNKNDVSIPDLLKAHKYFEAGITYMEEGKYGQAKEMFTQTLGLSPQSDRFCGGLGILYDAFGMSKEADYYYRQANEIRASSYNPSTRNNFHKMRQILDDKGIALVCVQYPMRSVELLKQLLAPYNDGVFVDNEATFKKAIRRERYDVYFEDSFGGEFGHCTPKGNRLLAENIAKAILNKLEISN